MDRIVYLDNNATTAVAPEVFEAMKPFLTTRYGNPSSIHSFGGRVRQDMDRARGQLASLLGADESEIVFTGCGSESDNAAIMAALELAGPAKKHVITTKVEHEAVIQVGHWLSGHGYEVTELGVDAHGALDLDELESSIRDDTALVSIMWANNETGVVYPIEKIASIVKAKGVYFHTDAVQSTAKMPIDLRKVPVDFLALSGHKFHAPKGVGALFVRKGIELPPFIRGGAPGGRPSGGHGECGLDCRPGSGSRACDGGHGRGVQPRGTPSRQAGKRAGGNLPGHADQRQQPYSQHAQHQFRVRGG